MDPLQSTRRPGSRALLPTEHDERTGAMLRGVVHDPTARAMGGVAGHAGVFSTADDVAKFAQAMLNGGAPVLSPLIVEKMTTPQQPPNMTNVRGLGWDIDSPFSSNRGDLLPVGSFGHTGFTGTSLWIDPTTNTYIILLTNAVNMKQGNVIALRTEVATAVAAALQLTPSEEQKMRLARITGYNEAAVASRRMVVRNGQVLTGIDVLEQHDFDALRIPGIRGAANRAGDQPDRRRLPRAADHRRSGACAGPELAAIFSPEHGITGAADTHRHSQLQGRSHRGQRYTACTATPTPNAGLPSTFCATLMCWSSIIQDVGARFYTYETTLGYFLEAAAKAGKPIVVLDRPNPINGAYVQGPISDAGQESFVNYYPLPVRHGMTIGELAKLYNAERHINANLTVVPMKGWMRGDWFDSTGQVWVNPSPNLRSLEEATLYPGVALIEGTNVSVGRGTDIAVRVGRRAVDRRHGTRQLPERAQHRRCAVRAHEFHSDQRDVCSSALQRGPHRDHRPRNVDAPELGIELAAALHKLSPLGFDMDRHEPVTGEPGGIRGAAGRRRSAAHRGRLARRARSVHAGEDASI